MPYGALYSESAEYFDLHHEDILVFRGVGWLHGFSVGISTDTPLQGRQLFACASRRRATGFERLSLYRHNSHLKRIVCKPSFSSVNIVPLRLFSICVTDWLTFHSSLIATDTSTVDTLTLTQSEFSVVGGSILPSPTLPTPSGEI